jgi:hypothetical protein
MITIDDYNYKFKTIIKSTVDKHKDMYEALILECYIGVRSNTVQGEQNKFRLVYIYKRLKC